MRGREIRCNGQITCACATNTQKKVAILFADNESIFKDFGHVPGFCVWKRSTVLQTKVFDSGLNVLSDMSKTTCTPADVARE